MAVMVLTQHLFLSVIVPANLLELLVTSRCVLCNVSGHMTQSGQLDYTLSTLEIVYKHVHDANYPIRVFLRNVQKVLRKKS